jgi:sialate O-acetylesterase
MNHKLIKKITFVIYLLLSGNLLQAKIVLPSVLSSSMVLQQQSQVKLWGKATSNAKVKIITSWNKKNYLLSADNQGNWETKIGTPVAGGPYKISIADNQELVLDNILIGEVWFCSGQSNMEMPMKGFPRQPVKNTNTVIARAKAKTPIRIFSTDIINGELVQQFNKQPQADCKGAWHDNSSENVANTSAVAYFFAKYLQEVLEVPVGIIVSSRGGSKVEAWMSREAITPFKEIDLSILDNTTEIKNVNSTPSVLFNSKIAPLTNYTIKGFLWYQGESNRNNATVYAKLMPAFVQDLRSKWNIEFPFYFVEIAPFNYEGADSTSAARLREVQLQNMKDIPKSGMVTTLDVGNSNFIHAVDKETVGTRLAWWALADTYGRKGFGYKPTFYKSMDIVDQKIYINFENAKTGISPMWTDLKGFEIAGNDKVFYPAKAEIETKTTRLAVSSDKVPQPVAVRYAYKNYPEASIFNVFGIPVVAFRTDDW